MKSGGTAHEILEVCVCLCVFVTTRATHTESGKTKERHPKIERKTNRESERASERDSDRERATEGS